MVPGARRPGCRWLPDLRQCRASGAYGARGEG